MKTVFVLNGPNLNALGKREPGIYGGKTLAAIADDCKQAGAALGLEIDFRQSNHADIPVVWAWVILSRPRLVAVVIPTSS